jgi:hypothetical protein
MAISKTAESPSSEEVSFAFRFEPAVVGRVVDGSPTGNSSSSRWAPSGLIEISWLEADISSLTDFVRSRRLNNFMKARLEDMMIG